MSSKEELKECITNLLIGTNRLGIKNLLDWMEENGFFTAPCSTKYHLCCEGGLAEHSLNVFQIIKNLAYSLFKDEEREKMIDSLIICSLLHDIGKVGQFGKPQYVDNYLSKKDKEGNPIRSETIPYASNTELLNVPHEIRSIAIISKFIELKEKEQFAILYHNGMYGDLKYQLSGKETPLYLLLHFADMWASRVTEVEAGQPE